MIDFDPRVRKSVNGNGAGSAANNQPSATMLLQTNSALSGRTPAVGGEGSRSSTTIAELILVAVLTGVALTGCVALVLAQLGRLTRTSLLLTLSAVVLVMLAVALTRTTQNATRNSQSCPEPGRRVTIRGLTWHDAMLAGVLLAAAVLYTPPADYAPAFLDAGWYTNTGALIARTGSLGVRPPVLEGLPAADRDLFVRTYHDLKSSIPQFPDRRDLGFYNLAFAIDLGSDGPVVPYHPPFTSVWIAVLRLVGGRTPGAYAAPLFGLLFVLAVYAAGHAIFGPNVGLGGALLTALSPSVVYYARTPFAELLAGALIWAGVYALTRYAATAERRRGVPRQPPDPGFWGLGDGPTRPAPRREPRTSELRTPALSHLPGFEHPDAPAPSGSSGSAGPLLLFAGLAFGAALLVKIESFLLWLPITLFWAIWLRRRWAVRREFATFLIPFGALSSYAALLYFTVLKPYTMLNGHGIWSMLATGLNRPVIWATLTVLYAGGVGVALVALWRRRLSPRTRYPISSIEYPISNLQSRASSLQPAFSLLILGGAGVALLLAWPATQAHMTLAWPGLVALSLFLTPLGLCLGIVGLSTLVADDLNHRTAFLLILLATAGLATVLMPAISSNVSYLYTVRRQLPIVLPALSLLVAYVTLRWAGLSESGRPTDRRPAGLRRGIVILMLTLVVLNYLAAVRPLVRQQELAGSSHFIAGLADIFDPGAIVLFESVDRGAHVGRFAAPLWAEHGITAMLLSSTYPPQDRLAEVIRRWQEQGRHVYFVSQSHPPPFELPNFQWALVANRYWAGSTVAAKMSFPPETWVVEVPFYIYEVEPERNVSTNLLPLTKRR